MENLITDITKSYKPTLGKNKAKEFKYVVFTRQEEESAVQTCNLMYSLPENPPSNSPLVNFCPTVGRFKTPITYPEF